MGQRGLERLAVFGTTVHHVTEYRAGATRGSGLVEALARGAERKVFRPTTSTVRAFLNPIWVQLLRGGTVRWRPGLR